MSSALLVLCAGAALCLTPETESAAPVSPAPAANSSANVAPAAGSTSVGEGDPSQASNAAQPASNPTSAVQPAVTAAKPAEPAASDLHVVEAAVIERTNAERVRYGLQPLVVDRLLMWQARRHTAWMTRARSLQHTSAMVAENIAMGQQSSADAVQCWMNSSGHRANILNAGHTRIGVAAYTAADGTTFWCQQFLR